MRHRSPRPVLDRLLRTPASGTARRGALVAAAVTGIGALGVTFAAPLVDPPAGGPVAMGSPVTATTASWWIGTPSPSATADRERRPSRGAERSPAQSPPTASERADREPTPAPETRQPSVSADEPSGHSPSRTARPSPSPTRQESPSPEDDAAPDTSATTSDVEDDAWTVTSDSSDGDSFECSLDGAGFVPCDPTETFDDLDNGKHTLEVRAVDEDGDVDATPVELVTNITGDVLD